MSRIIRQLQRELASSTPSPAHIDLLNRLAIESRDNSPEDSLELSNRAKELSNKFGYERGLAWSLLNIGYLQDFRGRKSEALANLEKARDMLEALGDTEGLGYAYKYLCWFFWSRGEVNKAMDLMFKGLKLNEGSGSVIEGWSLYIIAVFYSDFQDYDLALEYFDRSIAIFTDTQYEHGLGRALNGRATVMFKLGDNESALRLSREALQMHMESEYQMGIARSYNDIGSICAAMGDLSTASENLQRALEIREKAGVKQAVITTLTELGDVYFKQRAYANALKALSKGRMMAQEIDAKAKLIRIHMLTAEVLKATGEWQRALEQLEPCFTLKAAMLEQDAESRITSVESKFLAEKKEHEAEIERLRSLQLEKDKDRIETLFGQQVSIEIVKELVSRGLREADTDSEKPQLVEASIMFMDIRNFSAITDAKSPEEVIEFQNVIFSPLIDIIGRHNGIINQILGDGFMASFGIFENDANHCLNAFRAGCAIVEELNRMLAERDLGIKRIGIGLHTGEIITGNIGTDTRKQFSIAGRNVVIAARLEQLNKTFDTQFLITKEAYKKVRSDTKELTSLGLTPIKGFDAEIEVFKVC